MFYLESVLLKQISSLQASIALSTHNVFYKLCCVARLPKRRYKGSIVLYYPPHKRPCTVGTQWYGRVGGTVGSPARVLARQPNPDAEHIPTYPRPYTDDLARDMERYPAPSRQLRGLSSMGAHADLSYEVLPLPETFWKV